MFSLSDCFVCLVAGMGGKLSRPVYLAPPPPHPLGYQSKIILLILLILIYLIVMMYQFKTKFKSNSADFFVGLFGILSYRGGGKLSMPVYLDPHPPEYQSIVCFFC